MFFVFGVGHGSKFFWEYRLRLKILSKIDFRAHSAVIGRNGAGKSSVFRAMLNRQKFDGTIVFPHKSKVAIIADYANLPEEILVKDTIQVKNENHIELAKTLNFPLDLLLNKP